MQPRKLILHLYYALAFFVPVLFLPLTKEVFETPKMLFVFILGTLIFALYQFDTEPKQKINKWVMYLAGGYLLANVASAVVNGLGYPELFGYYGRFTGGLLATAYYVGLFYIAARVLKQKEYENVLMFGLLAYFLVIIYSFLQAVGLFGSVPERVYGTFGQPNWLAGYIVLFFPFVINKYVFGNTRKKYLWLFTSVLALVVLWLTYSLSGFIALSAALIYYLVANREKLGKYLFYLISAFVGLTLFLLVFFPGLFVSKLYDAYNSVFETSSEYKVSDPGVIRLSVWRSTWSMITASPKNFVLGVGPENFAYEFPKVREQNLNYSSEWEYIVNKPHNYFLEQWAEIGLIGIVLFGTLILQLFKKLPPDLGGGVVGLLAVLFFGFPVVALELWLWLMLSRVGTSE